MAGGQVLFAIVHIRRKLGRPGCNEKRLGMQRKKARDANEKGSGFPEPYTASKHEHLKGNYSRGRMAPVNPL